jgi:membrane-bound lytic murein transglycosylase B
MPSRRALLRRAAAAILALRLGGGMGEAALAAGQDEFRAFLETLWPAAQARGVTRATFDAAVAGLSPDPAVSTSGPRQSEFLRPMKAYVADAAGSGRVARGRAASARWSRDLASAEAASLVPAEILLAIWGLETDFGAATGKKDVLRSLATLAFVRGAGSVFADEFAAALLLLERGVVSRERLVGSWAGAMGHPQFMPSAYWRYAVSADGRGPADIWSSVPDSLASIARFLRASGWQPHETWGAQVAVPAGFGFEAIRQPAADFARQGIRPLDGRPLVAGGEAMLFHPVGVGGPAFLLCRNFFVLKAYNFSDNYAMAGAVLADRIAGREPLRGPWPDEAAPLDTAERARLQERLKRAGIYAGDVDGRFGPVTRDAVHLWQRRSGIAPADGTPSRRVLQRLDSEAGG